MEDTSLEEIVSGLELFSSEEEKFDFLSTYSMPNIEKLKKYMIKEQNKENLKLIIKYIMSKKESKSEEVEIKTHNIHTIFGSKTDIEIAKCLKELWNERFYFKNFIDKYTDGGPKCLSDSEEIQMFVDLFKVCRIFSNKGKDYIIFKEAHYVPDWKKMGPNGDLIKRENLDEYCVENDYQDFRTFKSHYGINSGRIYYKKEQKNQKNGTKNEKSIPCWLFDILLKCKHISYTNFDFLPYNPLQVDPLLGTTTFNLFQGFRARYIHNVSEEIMNKKIEPVLNHLKEVWSDNNEDTFQYILNWFSYFVKYPSDKQTCIILSGEEGSGKTLIIEWFGIYVLGVKYFTSVNNIDEMICKFNSHIAGALLINVQELKSGDNPNSLWETKKKTDGVKSVITDRRMRVEQKGKDAITILNSSKVIMSTNWDNQILYLTKSNRRFNIFKTSNKYVKNFEYFKELDSKLNQDTANYFFTFLLNRKITSDIQKIQDTNALQECIDSCKNPIESFLEDFFTSWKYEANFLKVPLIYNYKDKNYDKNNKIWYVIQKEDFFKIFKKWTETSGAGRYLTKDNFFKNVKKNYEKYFENDYQDRTTGLRYYKLKPELLISTIKEDGKEFEVEWINKPKIYLNDNTLTSNSSSVVSSPQLTPKYDPNSMANYLGIEPQNINDEILEDITIYD